MGKTPTRNRRQIMSVSGEKQTPKNRTYTVEDIAAILGI